MRLSIMHGLGAVALVSLALACDDRPNRSINDPASNPTNQPAFNDPQTRQPNDPIANNHNPSQTPAPAHDPQSPAIGSHGSQEAATNPDPQKPFYGPGLSSPDEKAKTDKPLSDNEIIGVALAANDGEVQMAEMAKKKATNADVKAFAAMMYTHHSQGVTKTKALQTKTKMSSDDSDLTQKLKSDVASTLSSLRDKSGRDFDKAYMDSQVKAHKDVLAAMDDRVLPNAKNTELKTLVGEMRRTVADHLGKAQDIQAKLDKSQASTAPATSKDMTKGKNEPKAVDPSRPSLKP